MGRLLSAVKVCHVRQSIVSNDNLALEVVQTVPETSYACFGGGIQR